MRVLFVRLWWIRMDTFCITVCKWSCGILRFRDTVDTSAQFREKKVIHFFYALIAGAL